MTGIIDLNLLPPETLAEMANEVAGSVQRRHQVRRLYAGVGFRQFLRGTSNER